MYKFLEDNNVKESGILDHYCKDKLTLDNIDLLLMLPVIIQEIINTSQTGSSGKKVLK